MKKYLIVGLVLLGLFLAIIVASLLLFSNEVSSTCCDCIVNGCCTTVPVGANCPSACSSFCPPFGGFDSGLPICSGGNCVPEFKDYLQMAIGGILILGACLFMFRRRDK